METTAWLPFQKGGGWTLDLKVKKWTLAVRESQAVRGRGKRIQPKGSSICTE